MAELNKSIDIKAPREAVWDRAIDELLVGLERGDAEVRPEGKVELGTEFEGSVQLLGHKAVVLSRVVEYEEYERMAVDLDVEHSELPFKLREVSLGIVALNHPSLAETTTLSSRLNIEPSSRLAGVALKPVTSLAGSQLQSALEQLRSGVEDDYRVAS